MTCSRNTKIAITVATVLVLSACGSSNDDDNFVSAALNQDDPAAETPVVEDTPVVTDTPDTPVEVDTPDTPVTDTPVVVDTPVADTPDTPDTPVVGDTPDAGGGGEIPAALFGPPQFILSECGSVAVSDAIPTNSLTAPTPLTVGIPVRGQLVPNSPDQDFHTWQVTLEPGNYHLVADANTIAQDGRSAIGLTFESLGATTDENERLASGSVAGFDYRLYEYLEIQTAQTLIIRVEASFDEIHNYTFGIFPNGTAVPTPFIERCLPITPLSIDSPQSVVLDNNLTRADDRFYIIDLESRQYQLDASVRSAERAAIGYSFDLLSEFAQSDTIERITSDSVAGTELITSETFQVALGTYWIRARISFDVTRTVEFNVSAQ